MAWALYSLTQNKHAQTKLRQEVSDVSTDNPTMDDLNGLPYLDAVVRETLRLYPPISAPSRAAQKDDFIPVSKPFIDRQGIVRHEIRLAFDSIFVLLYSNLSFLVGQGPKGSIDCDTYYPHKPR